MRIISTFTAICAATLIAAAPASAQEPQSNTVTKEKPKEEKKVCRWLPMTGSNLTQRVCLTPEDWKKAEDMYR